MPVVELTDRFCRTVKPVADARQTDWFDTVVKGLCLTASAGGAKTFYLMFTRPADGRRARMKLGRFPEIGLANAREKAREARGEIGEGVDPLVERRAAVASQTVADLIDNYVTRRATTKRTGNEIARRLRKNVTAIIGDVKLTELHRRDLTRCIDAVKDRGAHIEANRLFEDVRAMVRWARGRGDLDVNLVEGMAKPSEATVRDRVLTADELRTMWAALAGADMREGTRRVIRLCAILGQRVGEISGMRREELDLEAKLWTIPGERVKNKRDHAVPLSDMAVAVIRDQIADVEALDKRKGREPSCFVFPGPGGRAAISGAAVAKAIKREERQTKGKPPLVMGIAPWTCHDLRRSMATHLEELGVSPFIIGHVLNHVSITKASITTKVYARYTYEREKREALDSWADRLTAIVEGRGADVLPLRAGAR